MDGGLDATEQLIRATFGRVAPGRHAAVAASAASLELSGAVLANGANAAAANGNGMLGPLKKRHPVRPPVEHVFGRGSPEAWNPAPVSVFRHRLLQHFMLSVFCKLPIQPIRYVQRCICCCIRLCDSYATNRLP